MKQSPVIKLLTTIWDNTPRASWTRLNAASRRKGSRLPPNTVVVARPSAWGNPFRIGARGIKTNADAVRRFQKAFWMTEVHAAASIVLRGKNLACWCRLGEPCHADVLLAMANGGGL